MTKRFLIQKSQENPSGWILTDTANGVCISFEDGRLNDTQRVTVLDDMPKPSAEELSRMMREMGEWVVKYHGSKAFSQPYGFEYSEDNGTLYLYRKKRPKWRMEIESLDKGYLTRLAASLRKAAEFLQKGGKRNKE